MQLRQAGGEPDHSGLGDGVFRGVVAGCPQAGGLALLITRAAAALGDRPQDELRREHHRPQVQVERMLPFRRVRRGEVTALAKPPALLTSTPTVSALTTAVRTPAWWRCCPGANDRPIRVGLARPALSFEISDDNPHAFRREPLGDSGAYPRHPRHQGGSALKVHGGIVRRGTDNSAEQVRMTLRERSRR